MSSVFVVELPGYLVSTLSEGLLLKNYILHTALTRVIQPIVSYRPVFLPRTTTKKYGTLSSNCLLLQGPKGGG